MKAPPLPFFVVVVVNPDLLHGLVEADSPHLEVLDQAQIIHLEVLDQAQIIHLEVLDQAQIIHLESDFLSLSEIK